MFYTRQELELIEERSLAPYGCRSRGSRGRAFPEDEPEYRTAFQRDRDRILHTTAFRRLEYKTQVFINYEGDYYRTRLTHTLEVAQIGRTIARALGANEDLLEAICLAHDLGHPAFGHSGEVTLAMPKGLPRSSRSRSPATRYSARAASAVARTGSSLGSRVRAAPSSAGSTHWLLRRSHARAPVGLMSGMRSRCNARATRSHCPKTLGEMAAKNARRARPTRARRSP